MVISFAIVQFAPGGPVERVIAQISGTDVAATSRIGGGQGDGLGSQAAAQAGQDAVTSKYRGAQGLDPEFIKQLEKQFGFDKPAYERFFIMMKNYLMFDFRPELLPRCQRHRPHHREAAGVDLARPLDDAADLPHFDPARHPQGGA